MFFLCMKQTGVVNAKHGMFLQIFNTGKISLTPLSLSLSPCHNETKLITACQFHNCFDWCSSSCRFFPLLSLGYFRLNLFFSLKYNKRTASFVSEHPVSQIQHRTCILHCVMAICVSNIFSSVCIIDTMYCKKKNPAKSACFLATVLLGVQCRIRFVFCRML